MMKMILKRFNGISFKLGLLFSSIFLVLLLLLGFTLFELFSHLFVDYITQDLLKRGENHAKVLEENFNETTLTHVALMEQNVITNVVVTNQEGQILVESDPTDKEMKEYINLGNAIKISRVLNQNWDQLNYIATVSPIRNGNLGYVYMYYPTSILKEMVFVLKLFISLASIGIVLIAVGMIVILSKKMTKPLLEMKEATIEMAKGDYKQHLDVKGNDELAQLADSIQSLGEQLQYYEDTRNEFLASVSHELRTPLTYLTGYSDILIKGRIVDKQEQQTYLKIINEEAKRVTHLVNDLFDMSKIQTGQFQLKKEYVNLIKLVEKVIQNLKPVAEGKGLSILFNPMIDLPVLYLDPNRMEQVIYNLIENAIKYSDQGEIKVSLEGDKEFIFIKIEDQGIGVPEKELSRIWERFYRVEKSRARKTGGTGLGLYVVKEIVQLHGGQIEAKSVEGKGTTMIIKFKRKDVVL
ncbi:ATP-binding protein [Tepidibacillus sp. HK-1]|uniref:HAMP domain-containing sensor histidine kinase n=1 Tax=Tepidibacillus sp. HK-1 TaxID=1883407 RepID=UPI000858CEB4|nr:ATP-binding protein [Tepidibacillus sp. HK-1]GBF10885.1 sensor histidine kinase YycG [Tepidibacillus sp. HK-1]